MAAMARAHHAALDQGFEQGRIIAPRQGRHGRGALELEFTRPEDRPDRVEGLLDLIELVCEPLRSREEYDFAASDLASRARDAGLDLAFRRGFLRPPPPQVILLHRKLAGTFLLCARIRARVRVRALIEPFLEARGSRP